MSGVSLLPFSGPVPGMTPETVAINTRGNDNAIQTAFTSLAAAVPVSVMDPAYGAKGDGTTDDTAAFQAAANTGGCIYVPAGTYEVGKLTLTKPVFFFGTNPSATVIERNYSPTHDYDGVFNFGDSSSISGLSGMTIRSKTGQTGGCLLSIVCTNAAAPGLYRFDWLDLTTTGTDTHNVTVYLDGTARTTAPIGIRGVDFTACSVFGAATDIMLVKGILKFSFVGGGVYTAGGSATAVVFDGTASVATQAFIYMPSDNEAGITMDYATEGIIQYGGAGGAITNTAHTTYISGSGYSTGVDASWTNSMFFNTNTGSLTIPSLLSTIAGRITDGSGTGITVDQHGIVRQQVYRVTITRAALSAAAKTADATIATLPAQTRLTGIYASVTQTFSGGGETAATLQVGKTVGGTEYLLAFDAFTATSWKGLVDGDLGASMSRAGAVQGGDVPSVSGTTPVSLRLTTTTNNTSSLTQGSVTVWLFVAVLP